MLTCWHKTGQRRSLHLLVYLLWTALSRLHTAAGHGPAAGVGALVPAPGLQLPGGVSSPPCSLTHHLSYDCPHTRLGKADKPHLAHCEIPVCPPLSPRRGKPSLPAPLWLSYHVFRLATRLTLHDVAYQDGPRRRPILHRLSLVEMAVVRPSVVATSYSLCSELPLPSRACPPASSAPATFVACVGTA